MTTIDPRHIKSLIDVAADDAEHAATLRVLMQHRRAYHGQVRQAGIQEVRSRDVAIDAAAHLRHRVAVWTVAYRYIAARSTFGRVLALDELGHAGEHQMDAAYDLVSTTSAGLYDALFPRPSHVVITYTTPTEKEAS